MTQRQEVGSSPIIPVERVTFEKYSRKRKPWHWQVSVNGKSRRRIFAVCPACDNPVRIIGFYRPIRNGQRPYGRHVHKRVDGFREFDPGVFDWCPFIRRTRRAGVGGMRPVEGVSLAILRDVLENYDHVIALIERDTGLRFSSNFARKLLKDWLECEGYRYSDMHLQNIPWMVAYRTDAMNIFKQVIADNEGLKQAISRAVPEARIDDQGRIVEGSKFYQLFCGFVAHQSWLEDGVLKESLIFSVSLQEGSAIYEKPLTVRPDDYRRLVKPLSGEAPRNQLLLKIARDMYRKILSKPLMERITSEPPG